MKVILIKDCKDGKANTVVEVSDGYGLNYLVRNGFGVVYNEKNKKELDKKISILIDNEMNVRREALTEKEKLERETLKYELNANIDANGNLNVHGAISTKDLMKELNHKGYKLDKYAIQKIHLLTEGIHIVDVIVYKDIIAKLKVEVRIHVHQ
ncbi:50S ribosomal protein L9 [Mycoplasmopsis felifaucium]|uniref:50S ribosomal protein L9 n=1 Tax=Mycoplasmopsis felifaucium TaxID=35768 RepID=UPI000489026B|nr:50S ribosomal protein L9 [Mycoplasmopsis felifaucium]